MPSGVRHLGILGAVLAAHAVASTPSHGQHLRVQDRIQTVENGLLPAVRVQGVDIRWTIEQRMARYRVPGVSVAVINDGRIEWARGYGVLEAGGATSVDSQTLFQAASISKPVSVMAALSLVERGVLDLDSDVNTWLSTWELPENEFTRQHPVNLRGIMSHTAGLTIHGFPGYHVDSTLPTVPQILDGASPANTEPVRVDKVPGHGNRYSGGGTTLMQQLVVDVTGRPFPDFLRETVLMPLAMSRSAYAQPLPPELEANAATGHHLTGRPVDGKWHVYPELAAAGLWTTPSDLARFAIEIQESLAGRSNRVLGRETVAEMLTPQGGGPAGLGPFLDGEGEAARFGHGGANQGFRCLLVAYLHRGQGAVVMTNADRGSDLMNEIMSAIAVEYQWPGYLAAPKVPVALSAEVLERYVGEYPLTRQIVLAVTRTGNRLFYRRNEDPAVELFADSETDFFSIDGPFAFRFVIDTDQKAAEVIVFRDGQEVARGVRR